GTNGHLLGTSRSELYSKGIVSPLINHQAYYAMAIKEEPEYMTKEGIGSLKYLSGYLPFYNYENQLLGYLNIPYFVGINSLHQQISSIVVAIINAYLFFILIAVGLAILISRRIASPLIAIRESIKNVQLGKSNAKINYSGSDEIGNLITEFNRMLDELSFSAEKLAASERESAWREMAKQVAHEINNPLTPMKLSVQYLQRAWDEQREDYGKYMNRVTDTLIEQIDQLSVIASEFSSFAKMPSMNPEYIDVVHKIKSAIALFDQSENIRFTFNDNGAGKAVVYADGEQMGSVLNNLLKNAIQSIDHGRMGEISISLKKMESEVRISVADNGHGIPADIQEKMFKPNFTTKSRGMGLGLAIVKNIIIGMQGSIWFETMVGIGTTFHISIPLRENETKA
ncbi:MAG: HAMP domain-containing histidine kinase, partial [Breznakibacter sp.]|nr:HAMP domain-containing histidine kinase [Breznakibacter sp.]